MTNLLYICRENRDRSPVAKQITEYKLGDEYNYHNVYVDSAGIDPYSFPGLSLEMNHALLQLGYNTKLHTPKIVTSGLLGLQDIVLCMKKSHVKKVLKLTPELEDRVYTLSGYAGSDEDVPSPGELIKETYIFPILKFMPYKVRELVYNAYGYTDKEDRKGVIGVYIRIIKQIERYVDKAIERMREEGIISLHKTN
ncbi:MAG: hypothetical protein AABY14_01685 [Nanoarchaeota archaeon]